MKCFTFKPKWDVWFSSSWEWWKEFIYTYICMHFHINEIWYLIWYKAANAYGRLCDRRRKRRNVKFDIKDLNARLGLLIKKWWKEVDGYFCGKFETMVKESSFIIKSKVSFFFFFVHVFFFILIHISCVSQAMKHKTMILINRWLEIDQFRYRKLYWKLSQLIIIMS